MKKKKTMNSFLTLFLLRRFASLNLVFILFIRLVILIFNLPTTNTKPTQFKKGSSVRLIVRHVVSFKFILKYSVWGKGQKKN